MSESLNSAQSPALFRFRKDLLIPVRREYPSSDARDTSILLDESEISSSSIIICRERVTEFGEQHRRNGIFGMLLGGADVHERSAKSSTGCDT